MKTLIQERHNHSENCITVKASGRTQKVEIYLANEGSGFAFFSTDLEHISGSDVGNEFGVMLRGKRHHKQEFVYDLVRLHSLMIYMDLIEYNNVRDTKAPLLHCYPFFSKLKSRDNLTTRQYMNYQTFSNLQIRPLLQNCFHSIHIDLRDTSGEKLPFISVGITRLVWLFRKASSIHFFLNKRYNMVASRQVEIPFYRCIGRQRGRGFVALAQVLGRTAIPLLRKFIVPAAKRLGTELLEFAGPEIAEVVSVRMNFKTGTKNVGRQTSRKQLGSDSRKKLQAESIQQSLQNKPVGREETFLRIFLINHVECFSVPTFLGRVEFVSMY